MHNNPEECNSLYSVKEVEKMSKWYAKMVQRWLGFQWLNRRWWSLN